MPIEQNTALTPDKKQQLIDTVKAELMSISGDLKNKQFGTAGLSLLLQSQQGLQDSLNNLLQKKGVVTPSETNDVLDQLNNAKKARLEKQVQFSKTSVIFMVSIVIAVGITAHYILKKRKK